MVEIARLRQVAEGEGVRAKERVNVSEGKSRPTRLHWGKHRTVSPAELYPRSRWQPWLGALSLATTIQNKYRFSNDLWYTINGTDVLYIYIHTYTYNI